MTLRRRLIILIVGLSAAGLVVSTAVAAASLRGFVLHRVDQQLETRFGDGDGRRGGPDGRPGGRPGELPRGGAQGGPLGADRCATRGGPVPAGFVTEFYRLDGTPLCPGQTSNDPGGGPALTSGDLTKLNRGAFTVAGKNAAHEYRVLVSAEATNLIAVRAIDLGDANATWRRQAFAGGLISLVTLGAIGGLGLLLVRRGLRPLERIIDTADAISAGDRSQRVDMAESSSEVGRLGTAFNSMLESIDASFAEQRRSEERLRQFVADASHELRTPLTSIRGYAELQLAGGASTPDKLATSMRNIKRESDRMSGLVEDLLMLARLDEEPQLVMNRVDVGVLADDAGNDLRARDPARAVTVTRSGPAYVMGDEARLRQVLANLVTNASTHTPAGTPIELAVLVHSPGGGPIVTPGNIEVRVVDHGDGVPDALADHIFERFTRLDPSRTRASGGAGLGLAIVRALVDAHRGSVRVEPTPGGGATFVVALPAATAVMPPPAAVAVAVTDNRAPVAPVAGIAQVADALATRGRSG